METEHVTKATFNVEINKISKLKTFESKEVFVRGQPWIVRFSKKSDDEQADQDEGKCKKLFFESVRTDIFSRNIQFQVFASYINEKLNPYIPILRL